MAVILFRGGGGGDELGRTIHLYGNTVAISESHTNWM